jgi:polar amino acid transport system substrate-binding protein
MTRPREGNRRKVALLYASGSTRWVAVLVSVVTIALSTVCTDSGTRPASPSSPGRDGAAGQSLALPAGAERTSIKSWTDPRAADWKTRYPLFAPVAIGDGSLKRVQNIRNITICAQPGIGPVLSVDPSSNYLVGAEANMMAEVAKRLGIGSFTYLRMLFAARVPQLVSSQCDAFISGIAALSSRARWPGVKFTAPYRVNQRVIVVAVDSPYHVAEDLKGKTLAGWAGSEALEHARQLADQLGGGTTVLEIEDERALYLAVSAGRVAAYLESAHNMPLVKDLYNLRKLPDLVRFRPTGNLADDYAESPYHYGALAGMTRMVDGDLNLALSVAYTEMIADGTLDAILKKWKVDSSAAFDLIRPEAK